MPKAPVTVPTAVSAPTSALEKIEEIALKSTTATTPLVNEYLDSVSKYTSKDTPKSERATAKKMQDSHSRASEILLQDLLKIDGVNIPEGDDEARSRRRAVVKMMNTQLDRLDAAREAVKAFETASNTQANAGSGDVADNSRM
ncbi:hypothetical protein HDU84_001209 [Entophlyctis sp. JEL0112]|nr:hypothetical protein HDU84_001209 [Entophlyctis sp. JEL0112]